MIESALAVMVDSLWLVVLVCLDVFILLVIYSLASALYIKIRADLDKLQ